MVAAGLQPGKEGERSVSCLYTMLQKLSKCEVKA